ncbi:hypothetical protein DPMN_001206 [Dreissena polymorpha]|uniref:Uncharacterized protein n=1 Tax=Dreissena polymorpha TaxID=45954 RepID=A0A9D4MIX5_DREPO|nr:hypothetical protein DPMN_001206 [Dreissena polymorpha]
MFYGVVNVQSPRNPELTQPRARWDMVKLPPAQLSYHELAIMTDMAVITHAQTPLHDGLSVPGQYMEKLNYSIEFIRTKQYALQDYMHQQHAEKLRLMADVGKSMDINIVRLDYKTKGKKIRKKKKKKKSDDEDYDMMSPISSPKNIQPTKDITDEAILSTMDDKMMKKAKRDKINFRLLNVVAAVPEKVTHMDPVIQKLINKVDFNALDIIIEKRKELFQLLKDETQMPLGNAPTDILAVELTAGGLTHQLCAEQIQ